MFLFDFIYCSRTNSAPSNSQMLPSYGAKRSRVVSKQKNSLKRLFFVCESLRSDFSSEVYREKNKSAPESVSPTVCSHREGEFSKGKLLLFRKTPSTVCDGPPPSGGRLRTVEDACPYNFVVGYCGIYIEKYLLM